MLDKIRIVLVNTSHPGNIGAAARAMKTMGLTQLVLVSTKSFPDLKAIEMASNADAILENAKVTSSLEEALKGCTLAIGTSARSRAIALEPLSPRACAEKLLNEMRTSSVETALVFGREHAGLTNEELLHCHYHVNIPSNPDYSSLNLAAAVQVLCYEIRVAFLNNSALLEKREIEESFLSKEEMASIDEVEQFYQHLQMTLTQLEFLKKENPTLMPKVRRIFNRIRLEKQEVNILRGILTAVQKRRDLGSSSEK